MTASRIKVAIWGDSFALAAVEAVLRQMAHFDLCAWSEAGLETMLPEMDVDVILFDQNAMNEHSRALLGRLRPDRPLIGLDFSGSQIEAHLVRSGSLSIEDFGQFVADIAMFASRDRTA